MRLPEEDRCPACGASLDAATAADGSGASPAAGDATVCGLCTSILIFADDRGHLRLPTPAELEEIAANPADLAVATAMATLYRLQRRRHM